MKLLSFLTAAALSIPSVSKACDLALLLAVDVSGSIDAKEYRIQMDGLAAGLRDGLVVEALVAQKATVALIQWTGEGRQHLSVPWTTVASGKDAMRFADRIENSTRQWSHYSTAIGDALLASAEVIEAGPECKRRVLDISGDGVSNEGSPVAHGRQRLKEMGVTINAVVIETDETDLTAYFWENVITGSGAFVVTAEGFEDYPGRIRQKLIREVAKQLSDVPYMHQQIAGAL